MSGSIVHYLVNTDLAILVSDGLECWQRVLHQTIYASYDIFVLGWVN